MGPPATTLRHLPNALRARRRPLAAAVVCGGLALTVGCLAATALGNSSGGVGLDPGGNGSSGGSGSGGPPLSTTKPIVDTVDGPVSVQGDGITLDTSGAGQTGARLTFDGTVTGGAGTAGQELEIEYQIPQQTAWHRAAETALSSSDSFSVRWRVGVSGRLSLRALLLPVTSGGADSVTPPLTVTVFSTAKATWYGPGFWGHRTACGEKLRKTTLGVANRKLKCGTHVAVYYGGREIVVKVIDRGPYGHGASWDLTEATAKALHITETVKLGTLG